jgi:hypothetical protein
VRRSSTTSELAGLGKREWRTLSSEQKAAAVAANAALALIDNGAVIAPIDTQDERNELASQIVSHVPGPVHTTWAVGGEALPHLGFRCQASASRDVVRPGTARPLARRLAGHGPLVRTSRRRSVRGLWT